MSNVPSSEKSFLPPSAPSKIILCLQPVTLFHFIYNITTWNYVTHYLPTLNHLNTPTRGKFHQSRGLDCPVLQGPQLLTVTFALPSSARFSPAVHITCSLTSFLPQFKYHLCREASWTLCLKLVSSNYSLFPSGPTVASNQRWLWLVKQKRSLIKGYFVAYWIVERAGELGLS